MHYIQLPSAAHSEKNSNSNLDTSQPESGAVLVVHLLIRAKVKMRKSLGKKIPVLGSKPSPKHSGENVVSIHLEGGVHALDSRSTAENPVQSNCKEIQDGVHPGMKIFSGITAIVDCALTNGEITSVGVAEKLSRFGASIVKKWNEKVTHLIWISNIMMMNYIFISVSDSLSNFLRWAKSQVAGKGIQFRGSFGLYCFPSLGRKVYRVRKMR